MSCLALVEAAFSLSTSRTATTARSPSAATDRSASRRTSSGRQSGCSRGGRSALTTSRSTISRRICATAAARWPWTRARPCSRVLRIWWTSSAPWSAPRTTALISTPCRTWGSKSARLCSTSARTTTWTAPRPAAPSLSWAWTCPLRRARCSSSATRSCGASSRSMTARSPPSALRWPSAWASPPRGSSPTSGAAAAPRAPLRRTQILSQWTST
mmetsp:Transcript_28307/g.75578  ORF Transcript_28307/g.75578 Transcript_28307/m.75578 type:complete len:214 (-) Transcript_28307:769-1410(-)